ncbi:MAG: ribonuclease HII [Candidatus Poseidoniales archaeon]|nr:MAG: ribonuclease HII [Candidatus Poseidoniales archaeon]
MRLVGVDEAGRGPVLGPLVVGLLSIPKEDEYLLEEQRIEDSKHLSHAKRKLHYEWLNQQVVERGWYVDTIICQPNRIDNAVYAKGLNILEVDLFSSILNRHHRSFNQKLEILLDACDVNEKRFSNRISNRLSDWPWAETTMVAEHKADTNHRVVGGASILAKVVRDMEIERIALEVGKSVGSGYPSDPNTVKALPDLIKENGIHKDIRWSWATVERFWLKNYSTPLPRRKRSEPTLFSNDDEATSS